jgi:hypothetical protein
MHVTHWTKDRPHDDDLFEPFDRIITELKDRVDETGAPATTWGIHPEFGEVVAVRTAEGAVLVTQRSLIHRLAD